MNTVKTKKMIDMTEGPFLNKILKFSIPIMLTGLLQLLYNTSDTIIVGRFAGKEALAAVGSTGSLVALFLNIFMGLSMGAGVLSARYIGARDYDRVSKCTHTAMLVSIISGAVLSVVGFLLSRPMLVLMKSDPNVIDLSALYLKIYFLGAPASMVYNFGSSLVRSIGDTKRPLGILWISGAINVVLNLILVIPFKMSVSGVAIATIVSQYASAVMIVWHLVRTKSPIRMNINQLKIHKEELIQIVKIGLPAGLQNSMFSISNVIVQSAVNSFGEVAMAGIAAGSNVDSYIYICCNAIAQATMTFTSQNIGAKKYENLNKIFIRCITVAGGIAVIMSAFAVVLRYPIVGLFTEDSGVLEIGVTRLAQVLPFYVFCALIDIPVSQVRGMGKSTEPMIISLIGTCGIRLLWIFAVLPMDRTLVMLYWAYPVSWFITFAAQFVLCTILRRRCIGYRLSTP